MSKIQYISTTHTSKTMAEEHKQKCNTFHNLYFKDMTFKEIVELLNAGCIIGRVGNTTDFVAIDIDHTSINISTVFERYKDNDDIAVSYSASNNPLKYHILVNLHRTITRDEYKTVVSEEFEKIKSELCARCDYMELDRNADKFYQCFYGTSVENEMEYILDNSRRLFKWTKKGAEPMYFIENKTVLKHPSLNSADYCKKNGLLTVKEEKRYDIFLPSMTRGKLKLITQGHRDNWSMMIGAKLMMRIFYLNHKFNEGWSKWDYLCTFEWIIRTNVVMPDEFCNSVNYKGVVQFFDNKWDILFDKSYESICEILEPYFNCSKRQYKSRQYNPTVCTEIVRSHLINDNDVVFDDKEELVNICKDYTIDYYRTLKYIKSLGYNVVFVVEPERPKGKCLEGYKVIDNTVTIPRSEVTNAIKKYCSKNSIKIVRI